jgi:hypothetical protein
MPNHITNRLTIIGDKAEIARVFSEIKGERENQFIDFNKIVPLPTELDNTKSPMSHITQKEYEEQEHKIANNELTEDEKRFGLSRCLPIELSIEYKRKFGADNWYDWQTQNWGTKWNAYEQYTDNDCVIEFQTAWATPYMLMQKLSEKFPNCQFNLEYADEDFGYNVGSYVCQNGEVIEENIPQGGSVEAIKMAMDILGDEDYYLSEYLTEDYLSDSEELNIFELSLVELAHEKGRLEEGYPQVVLNKLKELALADEQYERIIEIDKLLKQQEITE